MIKKIIKRDLSKKGKKIGAEITNSMFAHGVYDWIVCFNTTDIQKAKGFIEELNKLYEGYLSEVHLIENMFTTVNNGVINPEIKKLGDFFKV